MGLDNRTTGNYITILQGKLCQRVPEGTEGAITRVNKVGNTVHEKFYDSFTGKLVDIKITESDYGKSWNFMFKDKEEIYTLQLSYSNSFSTAFLKMLPNIDLSKEMKVSPSTKEVDGKNKSSLFVNQDGKPLKHAYTRENPGGMPDMEQVTVNGVLVWDDTKRLEFLKNMVDTLITPKLAQAKFEATPTPGEAGPVSPTGQNTVAQGTPGSAQPTPVAPTPGVVAGSVTATPSQQAIVPPAPDTDF